LSPAFLQAMTSAHRKQLNKTNGNAFGEYR